MTTFSANDDTLGRDPHYKIELQMKRRNILTQYVKLFVNGQMPVHESYNVLRYFTKVNFLKNSHFMLHKCLI
jgi:hypothetical protein